MKVGYLFALAAVIACASGGTSASAPRVDRNVIAQTELSSVPTSSLYEAIEKLRPNFLRSRGQASIQTSGGEYAVVYMDGRPYGDLGSLRQILSTEVSSVHYYDAPSAQQRFGMISGSGVIEVISKH